VFRPATKTFHAALHFFTLAQMNVSQQIMNPRKQIVSS